MARRTTGRQFVTAGAAAAAAFSTEGPRLNRFALVGAFVFGAAVLADGQGKESLVRLFDGTLTGWTVENTTAGNFTVRDGLLRVEGPGGWVRSEREYADVSIRLEFRFLTPDADSGLFVRAKTTGGFGRGWPDSSYQVQIRNPATASRLPPVGGLFRHGVPAGETSFDAAAVEKAAKPTGEWQTLEVDVVGDRLTARLNGTEVLRAATIVNPAGYIGLQGETGALDIRVIELRER
jgi:hypothetical protein